MPDDVTQTSPLARPWAGEGMGVRVGDQRVVAYVGGRKGD